MSFENICLCGREVESKFRDIPYLKDKFYDECIKCFEDRMNDVFGRKFKIGDSVCYRTSYQGLNNLAFGKVIHVDPNFIRIVKLIKKESGEYKPARNASTLACNNVFIVKDNFLEKKLEVLNVCD